MSEVEPIRVVIIDDAEALRALLRMALELDGSFHVVGEAANGLDGVRVVGSTQPDVALLDLAMPIMGGVDAIPRMVEASPRTRIVVLSGLESLQAEQELIGLGVTAYLPKSMRPGELVSTLRSVWHGRKAPFEGLLQAAPDAMVGVRTDGTITFVNQQAEKLFGYPQYELLGRMIEVLVPERSRHYHPAHRAQYASAPVARPMGPGLAVFARRKDGTAFPAEISLSSIDTPEGTLVTAAVRDVTERLRGHEHVAQQAQLLELAHEAIIVREPVESRIVFWNREAELIYGFRSEQVLGQVTHDLLATKFGESQEAVDAQLLGEGLWAGMLRHVRKDGERIMVWSQQALQRDAQGRPIAIIEINSDVTERRKAQARFEGLIAAAVRDVTERQRSAELRTMQFAVTRALSECRTLDEAAPRLLRSITEALEWQAGGVWLVELDAAVMTLRHWYSRTPEGEAIGTVSRALRLRAGEGVAGRSWLTGRHVVADGSEDDPGSSRGDGDRVLGHVAFPILADERAVGVLVFLGDRIGFIDEAIVGIMADLGCQIGQFIQRRRAEAALQDTVARLAEIAATDPLTGLHNRREFERLLASANHRGFAVLAIDVDDLKQINDEFGHEAGDVVLRAIGRTLGSLVRGWDVAARIGGDEFAIILGDASPAEAGAAAERIRAAVRALSVPWGHVRISVGWAAAEAGADALAVWRRADEELFRAKRQGKDSVVGGHADHPAEYRERSLWQRLIERALEKRRIEVVYQPIVRLFDGAVVGSEALARPEGTGVDEGVAEFFNVVQKVGRIRDIDWLCRRAAIVGVSWPVPRNWALFVNVSAMTLMDPVHGVDQLLLVLRSAGADPTRVVLEITEREIISDLQRLRLVLASYREHGFRFAVDDVGEGHSTLGLLVAANPEFLKIARGLTVTATEPGSRSAILAAVAFAESSGATVLAEGIESGPIAEKVMELGITLGQGWWLGRPGALPTIPG